VKLGEIYHLIHSIGSHPTDPLGQFLIYVKLTLGASAVSKDVENMLIDKATILFRKYWGKAVRYSPDMGRIVPAYFATRRPMFSWKQAIREDRELKIRTACQLAGQVITSLFRLERRIIMIDIDPTDLTEDEVLEIIDHASSLGLPCKLTWHGGLHIYVPVKTDVGLIGVKGESKFLDNLPTVKGERATIEVKIDGVTHHPLQSWLWMELDEGEPSKVTLKRCAIPSKAPSINWFIYGRSLALPVKEAIDRFWEIMEKICKIARASLPTYQLREADIKELTEAVKIGDKFRGVEHASPDAYFGMILGEETLLRPDVRFTQFLALVEDLSERGLCPKCLEWFINVEHDPPDPHMASICGWYLAQQIKLWRGSEITHELGPHRARLFEKKRGKKMNVEPRYYNYYATPIIIGDEIYYPRPRYVKQLRQAWELLYEEGFCSDCPKVRECHHNVKYSSIGLRRAAYSIGLDIVYGLHEYIHLLNPTVFRKICTFTSRVIPL